VRARIRLSPVPGGRAFEPKKYEAEKMLPPVSSIILCICPVLKADRDYLDDLDGSLHVSTMAAEAIGDPRWIVTRNGDSLIVDPRPVSYLYRDLQLLSRNITSRCGMVVPV
jgi:hypothetical protein